MGAMPVRRHRPVPAGLHEAHAAIGRNGTGAGHESESTSTRGMVMPPGLPPLSPHGRTTPPAAGAASAAPRGGVSAARGRRDVPGRRKGDRRTRAGRCLARRRWGGSCRCGRAHRVPSRLSSPSG